MKISSLLYLIREGARSLWVNRLMAAASIGVLMACQLLVGGAYLVSVNINSLVGYVESQNEVVIFVKDEADKAAIDVLDLQLNMLKNVSEIVFVSKEDALEIQKKDFGQYAQLLEGLETDNPMPNAYNVRIADLSKLQETVSEIKAFDNVLEVYAPTEMAGTIASVKRMVYIFEVVVIGILLVVALLILSNTIKLTVFNRRKEVSIMKYVGATDFFIKMPFVIEGMMLGMISSVLAYLMIWLGYTKLLKWLATVESAWIEIICDYLVPFSQMYVQMLIGFLVMGLCIGTFGSVTFVRKYLKV